MGGAGDDELYTADEIRRLLRRGHKMVGRWVRDGLLKPAGVRKVPGRAGCKVYRLGDARALDAKFGRQEPGGPGSEGMLFDPPVDPVPCVHLPGSEGRIETYRRRVARGLAVFSPHDRKADTK